MWNSGTYGKASARLTMQSDGNLVIYNSSNKALWGSMKLGDKPVGLSVQNDGSLSIYNANNVIIWSSSMGGIILAEGASVSQTASAYSAYSAFQSILNQIYQRLISVE